ncbi:Hypothetical protein CINCED_3A025396 [Cinara cedri]|nr:Hypothetical protein CINCED_3A025396 [Cinara cedri]
MVRLPQDYEEGLLLEQNEPMRLKVSVSGRPLPQVTWLHDGEEIRGGDRFEVIHTDKYAALKLASIKRSDRGCYQIQAVNPLGEHTASFLVTVTDRPSPPGKVHVSKTSGKSVTLSWKPPEDDGGCKIGNYIIEYNRVGWDMWLKASTSRLLTADLDDLLEGSEYRFRVKAENPYGISVPSEMSDLIFFPDIKRGIYKPVITTSLLSEDEEGLVKVQETGMFEYFGRKSKSPEPPLKSRKLSVDEVSPPVPKRRKKKPKADLNSSESDIYKSLSSFDVSETRQQPIEQKDHWGLPPRLKANNANLKDLPNSQKATSLDYKTQGNSTDSLLLLNFERGPAPPISLSSPELGVESEAFEEHIRNSYSSSELLYERNLSRFNGYSNDDKLSSEAQKIAIYAMDRKDSLRRSPITRISNEGSEDKSILSDSDSIQSVVEISKKTSSYVSLAKSIEEKMEDEFKETINDDSDIMVPSTSFSGLELQTSKAHSDGEEYVSDNSSDEEFMKFGSGKRALEHNTSSAFFSTVYYDDDYLSDQKLSDRERSISPAANVAPEKSDAISQDSLNNSDSVSSDGDYSRSDKDNNDSRSDKDNDDSRSDKDNDNSQSDKDNDGDDAEKSSESPSNSGQTVENQRAHNPDEICTVESDDIYRPRDGIPKYVMLPNPFYRNHTAATADGSSGPGGTVPPEIPKREENNGGGHMSIPVITVTEMTEERYGPNTPILKQIFVPTFAGQNESYYDKYNNVNSSTFNTLSKRSPERDADREPVDDGGDRGHGDFDPQSPPETPSPPDAQENAEMIAVKRYGDIVERYSGVAKKTASKTYLDFEQLKMAAAVEHDQPVVDAAADGYYESGTEDGDYDDRDGDGDEYGDGNSAADEPETGSQNDDSATPDHRQLATGPAVTEPNAIPYLKIFGNLSLALLGFWLYAFKDERLSVPIFGFLSFRFFKTQIWDRI